MEYRKQAKAAMNEKISRMTAPLKGSVDASGWEVYDPLNADAKTGMRPVSRRAYKKGGKVDAKVDGKMCGGRADRKARQSGGKALTANSLINRNVKEANQERDGVKHVGGMKKGGRAKKYSGGSFLEKARDEDEKKGNSRLATAANIVGMGGGILPAALGAILSKKSGGRAKKYVGGGMPYGGMNYGIPQGAGVSKMRQMSGYKAGGKVSKEAWEHSKEDLKQDKKLAAKKGVSMEKWEKSKADEKHDKQQSMKGLKSGGRTKKQDGGGNSMKDDYYKKTYTGRGIRAAMRGLGMQDPYEDRAKVEMIAPKVMRKGKGDLDRKATDRANMETMLTQDPMDDRALVTNAGDYDRYSAYKKGGKVDHNAHKAIGHAVGAAMKAYMDNEEEEGEEDERKERKSGGRVAKAYGGGFGEEMNNPKAKSDKPSKGGKTPVINITINSAPKQPEPMVPGGPTMPLGAPPAPMPPIAGMGPPPPGGAMGGLDAGPMPPPGANAGPGPMPMPMPRKSGGRTNHMTAGAGSGEGRLQKAEWYGARPPKKTGGGLGMTAGAGSGKGRLQKIDAYGKKAY